jgi:toxin HigB-1
MQYVHGNKTLKRIDEEADFDGGYSRAVVKAFRMLMAAIRAATNENDLRAMKGYRFEKLKGKRKSDYSMRLNDQFRLTFQIMKTGDGNQILILAVEDYH